MRGIAYRAHHLIASPVRNSPWRVEQDGRRLWFVHVYPQPPRSGLNPCSTSSAPPRTRKAAFGPITRTGPPVSSALKARAGGRPGGRFSTRGGDNRLALVLARLSFWANVERAQDRAAEAAYALHASAAVVSPAAIRSTIAPASNGSQTLPLPMERNLAGARGPRQIPRYLIPSQLPGRPSYLRPGTLGSRGHESPRRWRRSVVLRRPRSPAPIGGRRPPGPTLESMIE